MIWLPNFGDLPPVIKAVTISQPWASLISCGEKLIENRCWETSHRGWLAIHAGSGTQYLTKQELTGYPTGCVVALARLIGCWSLTEIETGGFLHFRIPDSQRQYMSGPYCWFLQVVARVEPYAIPGKQKLWNLPTSELQLDRAPPDPPPSKLVAGSTAAAPTQLTAVATASENSGGRPQNRSRSNSLTQRKLF